MEELVETSQSRGIAGCMRIESETVLLDIPGRSGRINIIDDEAQQVDDQERQGITGEPLLVLEKGPGAAVSSINRTAPTSHPAKSADEPASIH
jgi:hypothetical protein